jgi:isopenicillin-N epimerase
LATLPLPDSPPDRLPASPIFEYPLQDTLRLRHQTEVPVIPWPAPPQRQIRIAPQLYNSLPQYERLAKVLVEELDQERERD